MMAYRHGSGRSAASRCILSLLSGLAIPVSSLSSKTSSPLTPHLSGQMILAPLTRAGNLPYRRLCADFCCSVSLSEMIYARSLLKGDPIEKARLRRAPNERIFGVQIATNQIEEGVGAIKIAKESGADFVDLNCGCPIYEATRRGLGSSLLRSPEKLGRLVSGLAEGAAKHDIPLTVKIRLGCETPNVWEVVRSLQKAGASAVTIHGRTAQQGYSKGADWALIEQAVRENADIPIIGNGDILTHYEASARMQESGVDAVMVGRGALIQPWIFQEFNSGEDWDPSIQDRIAVYRRLANYMKDHFGDDDMGRKKSWYFLPWHFEFLSRYMPLPEGEYGERAAKQPLIQTRLVPEEQTPLQSLLAHKSRDAHELIAAKLWESGSDADAVRMLSSLAESHEFKKIQAHTLDDTAEEELANIPKESKKHGKWLRRRRKNPKPKRSPEEIAAIRAERAAKKARLALEEHGSEDDALDGPLKDHKGVIKRWVPSGNTGQFGCRCLLAAQADAAVEELVYRLEECQFES